jgi:hypothetical protein
MGDVSVSRSSDSATSGPRSLGHLFGEVSRELAVLVKQEVELAKTQLREELAVPERSDLHLGGVVLAGFMSLLFVSLAAAWGLSEIIPAGFAFLVLGLAYAGAAAVLVWRDRQPRPNDDDLALDRRMELVEADNDGS